MGEWIKRSLGELGSTYSGLSGKKKEDFGIGKAYIPYMNIFSNTKVNTGYFELVKIGAGEKQNRVEKGDIFFTTSSETVDEVGMTSVLTEVIGETYLNSFCFGFRFNDKEILQSHFISYLLRSEEVRKQISFNGQGSTRYNISKKGLLKNVILKFPKSKEEQAAIAEILGSVDQSIKKTEQLIAKYGRIKTGLMQDLLTRGIDEEGNIRREQTHVFKDSALGRIPVEWEVVTITYYIKNKANSIKPGPFGSSVKKEYYCEKGYKIYGQEQVIANNPFIGEYYIDEKRFKLLSSFKVEQDDVLLSCVGTIGSVLIIPNGFEKGIINPRLIKFSLDPIKTDIRFFAEYLKHNSINSQLMKLATGGTMPVLNKKIIMNLQFVYPPKEEQKKILEKWQAVNELIDLENINLFKLKKLKTGLMQDLLTGKVGVDTLMQQEKAPQSI